MNTTHTQNNTLEWAKGTNNGFVAGCENEIILNFCIYQKFVSGKHTGY